MLKCMSYIIVFKSFTRLLGTRQYSRMPEIETVDLSQSHASLNFGLIVYFIESLVQLQKNK